MHLGGRAPSEFSIALGYTGLCYNTPGDSNIREGKRGVGEGDYLLTLQGQIVIVLEATLAEMRAKWCVSIACKVTLAQQDG